tara:strand:+ start:106 stop:531 length:426 start_codon:yes stop_codon:yes gene_type:complete
MGERIFLWTLENEGAPTPRPDNGVSLKLALHDYFNGNDFTVRPWGGEQWKSKELAGHRGVVAGRDRSALEALARRLGAPTDLKQIGSSYDSTTWWTVPITAKEWNSLAAGSVPGMQNLWTAFGTLPNFMDVRKYAGAGSRR